MTTSSHCKAKKCKRAVRAKGYCDRHYKAWRRGELPKPRYRICKAENCRKPMVARGLCQTHFDAWKASRSKAAPAAASAPAPAPAQPPAA
jgi:hypothetical protein